MKKCLSLILSVIFLFSVFFIPTASANSGFLEIYGLYLTKEGDSTLLNMDGNWLLIDTGSEQSADELVNKLKNDYGITKLDLYISHLHYDHYGAYRQVAENFNVGKLYLPDYNVIATEYESNQAVAEKIIKGVNADELILLKKGSTFSYGTTTATVLGPVGNYTPEEADPESETYKNDRYGKYLNNYSLTTKFVCGKYSYLTCGDIEQEEEEALLKTYTKGELKADIMKFSHHGISTSNKIPYLEAVDANYFYGLNSTYTHLVTASSGSLVRCTYTSIENASKFGFPFMVGDEEKDFCLVAGSSGINVYRGSVAPENKLDKWVNVYGSTGRKNDLYDTYYLKGGEHPQGITEIDGNKYLFSSGGCLIKGYYKDGVYHEQRSFDEGMRAFKETGEMHLGFATVNGYLRYFDKTTGIRRDGVENYGIFEIEGSSYAINENGVIYKSGWKKFGNNYRYFSTSNGKMKTGWLTVGSNKYYLDKTTGLRTLGLKKIGDDTYYFIETNSKGCVYKGGWKKFGNNYRYFSTSTGKMLTGWLTVGSNKYYLDKTTGLRTLGLKKIGKSTYYFVKTDSKGYMYKGWKKFGNDYRYFSKTTGKMKTGWLTVGSKKYYLNKTTGFRTKGLKKIGKNTYYFVKKNNKAYMYKDGWKKFGKKYRYFSKSSGKMKKGWQTIKGKKYYFNSSGYRVTGKQKIKGKTYKFSSKGVLKK